LFSDPKKSRIDIVQAVGRALRISKDKQFGYIIIPVLTPDNATLEEINAELYNNIRVVVI
jgi:predicted helicase